VRVGTQNMKIILSFAMHLYYQTAWGEKCGRRLAVAVLLEFRSAELLRQSVFIQQKFRELLVRDPQVRIRRKFCILKTGQPLRQPIFSRGLKSGQRLRRTVFTLFAIRAGSCKNMNSGGRTPPDITILHKT
jgi:hypothetical protein